MNGRVCSRIRVIRDGIRRRRITICSLNPMDRDNNSIITSTRINITIRINITNKLASQTTKIEELVAAHRIQTAATGAATAVAAAAAAEAEEVVINAADAADAVITTIIPAVVVAVEVEDEAEVEAARTAVTDLSTTWAVTEQGLMFRTTASRLKGKGRTRTPIRMDCRHTRIPGIRARLGSGSGLGLGLQWIRGFTVLISRLWAWVVRVVVGLEMGMVLVLVVVQVMRG